VLGSCAGPSKHNKVYGAGFLCCAGVVVVQGAKQRLGAVRVLYASKG